MKSIFKYYLSGALIILYLFGEGQNTVQNKVEKFKVSAGSFSVFPYDIYLFIGYDNCVKIIFNPKTSNYAWKITNGTKKVLTDSTFVINNLLPVNTLLSIYLPDKNGEFRIVYNKPYQYIPFPSIKIAGVRCDSAITKLMLAAGTFYADFKYLGKFKIKSFKMEMYTNKEFVQDSSLNGRLTKKMLEYVSKLKPGSLLYFKDLKFVTSDGIPKTEPIYRVFLIEDEKYLTNFGL